LFYNLYCCGFWIRDPGWVKIRIRDKHPGSTTLLGIYLGDADLDPEILHLGRREESLHSGDNGSLCTRQNDCLTKLQPSIHLNKSNENKSTYSTPGF
jgi:hypothetical protein